MQVRVPELDAVVYPMHLTNRSIMRGVKAIKAIEAIEAIKAIKGIKAIKAIKARDRKYFNE